MIHSRNYYVQLGKALELVDEDIVVEPKIGNDNIMYLSHQGGFSLAGILEFNPYKEFWQFISAEEIYKHPRFVSKIG